MRGARCTVLHVDFIGYSCTRLTAGETNAQMTMEILCTAPLALRHTHLLSHTRHCLILIVDMIEH